MPAVSPSDHFANYTDNNRIKHEILARYLNLRLSPKADLKNPRVVTDAKLELLCSSMTIRLGSMLVVGLSLLFAALKLT